ncbi:g4371 [Coccomyxa viridis]|uniref:Gamma-soluble NSF attachment protein n=1 Tax=Coccomyxa viridis TaxID=1274662 RepID=A0ABP1FQ51_9CHLO
MAQNEDYKKAEKLCKSSLLSFRMTPDWATATPLYEKAANTFRVAKDFDRARDAFEKAATGHSRQGSPWQSGKSLEKAADMEKEWSKAQQSSKGKGTRVEALYRDAALSFQEAGRHQAAAEALGRAAVHLEGIEPEASSQLYMDAINILADQDEGKEALSGDLFRQAIAGEIRLAKYPEAVALLMRFAAACDSLGLRPCKAYLSAVITWLYAQDGAQALSTLQDALEVPTFSGSEEAQVAEGLIDAYRKGDAEVVRQFVASHSIFLELDNQVVRLARKLPQGDVKVLAASLGAHQLSAERGADEDDLT